MGAPCPRRSHGEVSNQGIMEVTARFTRRRARFIIEVFFAVFLRFVAARVTLRFFVVFVAAAFFLRLAMRISSVEDRRIKSDPIPPVWPIYQCDRQGSIQPATCGGTGAAASSLLRTEMFPEGAIPMSDPYGYDRNTDPRYDPNVDDSGATALWAGIAVAALLIVGGFLYFSYDRSDNLAANAPGTSSRATMPSAAPGTPPTGTTGSGGSNTSTTPSTTGSAPSR